MRNELILSAALALALTSATGASAQTMQYDRTGDHMYSFGAVQPAAAPKLTRAERQADRHRSETQTQYQSQVQFDRTGDHMFSYGPASQ